MSPTTIPSPRFAEKISFALRVTYRSLVVRRLVRHRPLPEVVERMKDVGTRRRRRFNAGLLGRGVAKVLRIGPFRTRCLIMALVHYRLLREQGDAAELVIGLEEDPHSKDAHAWVEIDGIDVGPPPGRGSHRELIRY